MVERELTFGLPDGLNRNAGEFIKIANNYSCQLLIEFGNKKVNAKSLLGVLSLMIEEGDVFNIIASGDDAAEAVDALEKLIINAGE